MFEPVLDYPVLALDGRQLLPAGIVLTPEVMAALVHSNRDIAYPLIGLMRYGRVRQDILSFLGQPPYSNIFDDPTQTTELLSLMERAQLPLPLLESLDYFKENDFYTYRHILMVFTLSTLLGSLLVSDYANRIHESLAGPTHDFGKISVPLAILTKAQPLTQSEYALLQHHCLFGYVLVSYYFRDPHHIAAITARDHHERRNGSGYPRGIRKIDPMVEIVTACDVYDALISPRPYRPNSYDNRTALDELIRMAEKNTIGWAPVKALVAQNRKEKPDHRRLTLASEMRGLPPENSSYGIFAREE